MSATPRPFLRWAGSKRGLLSHLVDALPGSFRRYHEPFLGSGSLFFLLQPVEAILSDASTELVETFTAVRDRPELVLRYIADLKVEREFFYRVRANRSLGRYKRAAEFIYLNKACWNGLYRVNANGDFNVPYGAPKTANVVEGLLVSLVSRTRWVSVAPNLRQTRRCVQGGGKARVPTAPRTARPRRCRARCALCNTRPAHGPRAKMVVRRAAGEWRSCAESRRPAQGNRSTGPGRTNALLTPVSPSCQIGSPYPRRGARCPRRWKTDPPSPVEI
jgi:hypothetical protein